MFNGKKSETGNQCQAEILLKGSVVVGTGQLIEEYLRIIDENSYEEFGDFMQEGTDIIDLALKRANSPLKRDLAKSVLSATVTCVQERYLGNCSASRSCADRKSMDRKLQKLEIRQYKTQAEV